MPRTCGALTMRLLTVNSTAGLDAAPRPGDGAGVQGQACRVPQGSSTALGGPYERRRRESPPVARSADALPMPSGPRRQRMHAEDAGAPSLSVFTGAPWHLCTLYFPLSPVARRCAGRKWCMAPTHGREPLALPAPSFRPAPSGARELNESLITFFR